jgi:hypothetical protein
MFLHRLLGKRPCQSVCLIALVLFQAESKGLPARLVLAVDGIAYRDVAALQSGVVRTNFWGKKTYRRAFTADEGYFPVSHMISTFPSASDVAWTDIFGDRPLPGYQRTYYSAAANTKVSINSVTTSMEHERQMHWQETSGFLRAMGYLFPLQIYKHELRGLSDGFWDSTNTNEDYYVYLRTTDDAQHMKRDSLAMLCRLDEKLQDLRTRYQAQEGRDLQIVIISDHGHNHAGRGRRVGINSFLAEAGYRVTQSITNPKDVVLPTAGIESWVEVHNAPEETARLASCLCHLEGVDVVVANVAGQSNRFLVMNSQSDLAYIDWRPADNTFRYSIERGDPLHYRQAVETLARNHQLADDAFATADNWLAVTITNHYPNALERIAHGLTRNTLNPATILISLDNRYVHAGWWVQQGSRLVPCGSTHGGLDDLCSDGILLSNFMPTRDTTTGRVAAQFEDFRGVRNFRAEENGAEWLVKGQQGTVRIKRQPFDSSFAQLPDDGFFLRVWSPAFTQLAGDVPLQTAIEKANSYGSARARLGEPQPPTAKQVRINFAAPALPSTKGDCERIYALPSDLVLKPRTEYRISGWIGGRDEAAPLFVLNFRTGNDGRPLPY